MFCFIFVCKDKIGTEKNIFYIVKDSKKKEKIILSKYLICYKFIYLFNKIINCLFKL